MASRPFSRHALEAACIPCHGAAGLGLTTPTVTTFTGPGHYVDSLHTRMSPFLPPFPYPEVFLTRTTFFEGGEAHTANLISFATTGVT